jgi:hypothetical protein
MDIGIKDGRSRFHLYRTTKASIFAKAGGSSVVAAKVSAWAIEPRFLTVAIAAKNGKKREVRQ